MRLKTILLATMGVLTIALRTLPRTDRDAQLVHLAVEKWSA